MLASRIRSIARFCFPFLLTALVYKSQHLWGDWIRGAVRVREPWAFDYKYFGIDTPAGRLTPNEWWRLHTHWFFDLLAGAFYLGFVAIYIAIAAAFHFAPRTEPKVRQFSRGMPWAFFWLNLLGYLTYYAWPAAPPWYVADHGFGPADFTVHASPAGAVAFDRLLGTSFFTGMYGLSADVFGAVPSLHVAYPALALVFSLGLKRYRLLCAFYFGCMVFSAIYLNHHYVLDALWGVAYAFFVGFVFQVMARSEPGA